MHLYCDLIHPGSQVPPVQDANLQTVRLHDVLLSLCVHVKVIFFVCRSMNENARLAEIVEAVKELEQAITKDSGVPSKQQATSMTCTLFFSRQDLMLSPELAVNPLGSRIIEAFFTDE